VRGALGRHVLGDDSAVVPTPASRMNEADGGCNRRTVLTSRGIGALALGLGLLTGGCGAQGSLGSLDGLAAGTTTLRIANHVAASGQLEGVTIAVDGETVPLSSVPPYGGDAATIASLRLAPGGHSIAVRAQARAPGSEVIVVGAQLPFLVERGPAAITIDVRSAAPGISSTSASPVAVALTIRGGRMAPDFGVAPSDDKDERCATLLPIPRALCRAAVDLDTATRKNDIVAALCVRDKLAEMRKLAIIGESGKVDSMSMAEAQVAQLSREVELCAGDVVATPGPDGLTVIPPR
jgi:hypothetical protein